MSLPPPEAGLVVDFEFLWQREAVRQERSGRKSRPVVLVTAVRRVGDNRFIVTVLPLTTQSPGPERSAVELPQPVKQALGLRAPRTWILTDETNETIWPNYLGRTPQQAFSRGKLPLRVLRRVQDSFHAALRERRLRRVIR